MRTVLSCFAQHTTQSYTVIWTTKTALLTCVLGQVSIKFTFFCILKYFFVSLLVKKSQFVSLVGKVGGIPVQLLLD